MLSCLLNFQGLIISPDYTYVKFPSYAAILGLVVFCEFFVVSKTVFAEWLTFRNGINRSGISEYTIGDLSPLRWTSIDVGTIKNPPVVDPQGNIYLSTVNGIAKLNSKGDKLWLIGDFGVPSGSPAIDDNSNLYFATSGCIPNVFSLDTDGKKRWQYDLRQSRGFCGSHQSNAALGLSKDKKTLYVGVDYPSLSLLAFNLDGTVKWQTDLQGFYPGHSSVALASDGTIYVGTGGSGYLFALSDTGSTKWYRFTGSGPTVNLATPVVDSDNNVYVTTYGVTGGDILFSFTSVGNLRWGYQIPGNFNGNLALKDGVIYTVEGNNLHALNISTGTLVWKWSADTGTKLTSPVVDKNGVIITTGHSKAYALSPDGNLKSSLTLSPDLGPAIIGGDGLVYVYLNKPFTYEGYLYALGQAETVKIANPVIFIPGIGGSEFKASQDIFWSQLDGHGGTFSHAYKGGEKVWVNQDEAVKLGDDDYFDVLRLKPDGQTAEADLSLTGDLTPFGYSDIDQFFKELGYGKGKNYFIFPYDWRKDIRTTKDGLDALIEQAKAASGKDKVNIVAHSMGGLVARYYIADEEKAKKINKLIGLGVPHLGAPSLLKALMYGDKVGPSYLFGLISLNTKEVKDVLQNFAGSFQLSPSAKYYEFYDNSNADQPYPFRDDRDIDKNGVNGALAFSQFKTLLSNLGYNMIAFTIGEQLHGFLNPLLNQTNYVKLYEIVGSNQPTLGQIHETWLITWPINLIPKREEILINGDGTVPLYSASLKSPTRDLSALSKIYYVEQTHSDLVKTYGVGMQTVKAILSESDALPVEVKSEKIDLEGKHISVDQENNLDLYDELGNHTGLKENGEIETNIPETFYDTSENTKNAFVKSKSKKVKTKITSKKIDGKVNIKIRHHKQDTVVKTTVYKDIPISDTNRVELSIDPTTDISPQVIVDSEQVLGFANKTIVLPTSEVSGAAALDQIPPKSKIDIVKDQNKATVTITGTDSESGVLKTEYSLDNGKTVNIYTGPFIITSPSSTLLQVKSIDKLGNEEIPQTVTIELSASSSSNTSSTSSTSSDTTTPNPTVTQPQDSPQPQIPGLKTNDLISDILGVVNINNQEESKADIKSNEVSYGNQTTMGGLVSVAVAMLPQLMLSVNILLNSLTNFSFLKPTPK